MQFHEEHQNLFAVDRDYYLVHCISSDLKMGAGIAVPIQKTFKVRNKILASGQDVQHPTCIRSGRTFNLITKAKSNEKPTYEALGAALQIMKNLVRTQGIKKIAMPRIGCGLDRLQWERVREMIKQTFDDLEVEILVCVWR